MPKSNPDPKSDSAPKPDSAPCPCGSGKDYAACCEPFVTGAKKAPTAEALMRARYTAYAKAEIDFLLQTVDPNSKENSDRESTKKWATESEWLGLEILSTEEGGPDDRDGAVEFIARYKPKDAEEEIPHHEVSRFRKDEKLGWVLTGGRVVGIDPIVNEEPKVGRNTPCPCGSGKKYKKCCGA